MNDVPSGCGRAGTNEVPEVCDMGALDVGRELQLFVKEWCAPYGGAIEGRGENQRLVEKEEVV